MMCYSCYKEKSNLCYLHNNKRTNIYGSINYKKSHIEIVAISPFFAKPTFFLLSNSHPVFVIEISADGRARELSPSIFV